MTETQFNNICKAVFITYIMSNYSDALSLEQKESLAKIIETLPEEGFSLENAMEYFLENN